MSLALDELLLLVGRLDDAAGFDTPRERFRRFLLERVTDLATARALIDECQRSVGEQRHRALHDLVVLLGRLLQFEIAFGSYDRSDEPRAASSQWRSPGLLTVVLEIRTEQTRTTSFERLAHAVAAPPSAADANVRIGLCVVARQYAARSRLGHLLAADTLLRDIRVISVQSLLSLAELVVADRMSHGEVVKLLRSGFALDFVVGLLDRQPSNTPTTDAAAAPTDRPFDYREPAFWVATITGSETADADRFLRSVIAHRRVLAIAHSGRFHADGSPGDWVCFHIPGKGIVGHAQLMSTIEDGASVVRQASRFSRVYRLADVALYDAPIVQALRAERPFTAPAVDVPLGGACLAPIAKHDFVSLTTYRDGSAAPDRSRSATA